LDRFGALPSQCRKMEVMTLRSHCSMDTRERKELGATGKDLQEMGLEM